MGQKALSGNLNIINMSVVQSHAVYRAILRAEKRGKILQQLPENVQLVWGEYRKLGRPNYYLTKVEKFAMYLAATCMSAWFFMKGRKIKINEIYNDFLIRIETSNKKFEELDKSPEVKLVVKTFKENNVAWNNYR